MSKLFLSSQLNKIGWDKLSESNKQVLINRATDEINRLQFIGDKLDETQPNAFPRLVNDEVIDVDKIENAIAQLVYNDLYLEADETMQRIQQGITSIKIADASESYSLGKTDIEDIKNSYKKYLVDFIYRGC